MYILLGNSWPVLTFLHFSYVLTVTQPCLQLLANNNRRTFSKGKECLIWTMIVFWIVIVIYLDCNLTFSICISTAFHPWCINTIISDSSNWSETGWQSVSIFDALTWFLIYSYLSRTWLGATHRDPLADWTEERLCTGGRWRHHISQRGGILLCVQSGTCVRVIASCFHREVLLVCLPNTRYQKKENMPTCIAEKRVCLILVYMYTLVYIRLTLKKSKIKKRTCKFCMHIQ